MTAGWDVDRAATVLLAAENDRVDLEPITDEWTDLDLATAYAIQDEVLRRKLAAGERVIGVKLGLTSIAKQQRMSVSSPLTGWLTDAMVLPTGVPVEVAVSSLSDVRGLRAAMRDVDIVFHLAGGEGEGGRANLQGAELGDAVDHLGGGRGRHRDDLLEREAHVQELAHHPGEIGHAGRVAGVE